MAEISINSINELEQFAAKLARDIKPESVILLNGEMGAGKTTFVQAFSKVLGVSEPVRSPTFIIHNEYSSQNGMKIHHLDLYRLTDESELDELRILESIKSDSYVFIEWAEKFEDALNNLFKDIKKYKLDFDVIDESKRMISFDEIKG